MAANINKSAKESNKSIKELCGDIESRVSNNVNEMNVSKKGLEKSVDSFKFSISSISESIQILTETYTLISGDIEKVLTCLQFQDIIRQQLEHIIAPLKEFDEKIAESREFAGDLQESLDADNVKEMVKDKFNSLFTMEDERDNLKSSLAESSEDKNTSTSSVEDLPAAETGNATKMKDKSDNSGLGDNIELF